jgi:hypothetical protein
VGSPKQEILCRLLRHGFVRFRTQQSWAASGSCWWLFRHHRKMFRYGYALADLLHNLDRSILEPEFVERDLWFINSAIPYFLRQVGGEVEPYLAGLLLAFYEAVPPELKERLTWHPAEDLRAIDPRRAEEASLPDAEPGPAADGGGM